MKKMKKRWVFVLAVLMLLSIFAGCADNPSTGGSQAESGSSGSQVVNADETANQEECDLTFIYPVSTTFEDQDLVSEAIGELAKTDLNINLNVMPMLISEAVSQTSLMIASGEDIDVFPAFAMSIASFVESGYVLDLTDYLDKMPNSLEWVGREDIACSNVGGYIWGVTTMRERCNPQALTVRADILEEIGVNADDVKTYDDITEMFAAVREKYPDMVILSGSQTEGIGNASDMALICDPLNDELGVLNNYGEELDIVNEFETEQWVELIHQVRGWYEAGYISKDMATSTDSGASLFTAGNLFSYPDNYKPNTVAEKKSQTGYDVAVIKLSEPISTTTSTSGLGYAVSGVTENPGRAVDLLDWIFGSGDVNDLMNFGIEGKHWVEDDIGTATYPEGVSAESNAYHLDWGWAIPNQFAGHLWEGNDIDLFEQYQAFRDNAHISRAYGFSFDSTSVVDEVIACKAVLDEYLPPITTGSVDPGENIEKMNQALYDAGLQKVMDEKQRQLDEWAANQ